MHCLSVLVVLLVLGVLTVASNVPPHLRTDPYQLLMQRAPPPLGEAAGSIKQKWLSQKLDHFNPMEGRTWQQRYFISDEFYKPGGPVFLFLGGEWESSGSYISTGIVKKLASQMNALTFDLEHRFYGQSHPTENTSSENLLYLSTDQALADAAYFADAMNSKNEYNISSSKWVVFGVSYSANLAAWARAKYPHLFYAAYVSSGPVLAKVNFSEYAEVVGEALQNAHPECPVFVSQAMTELQSLIARGGAAGAQVSDLLNLCESELDTNNPEDVQYTYLSVVALFYSIVQFAQAGSLATLCERLVTAPGPALTILGLLVTQAYAGMCLTSNRQAVLNFYRDNVDFSSNLARQWNYQTCTELGYFQTVSSENQPFGQLIPLEFFHRWCSEVYGPKFTREVVEAGVARTNLVNGGLTPDVTRVLYIHGSLDPWHALGIQTDLHSEAPVIMIEGASHCEDIRDDAVTDSPALTKARIRAAEILTSWLQD